jgi:ubiquinone biosynthesis protein
MAIEELGTTFVKLGQILSTRADLLPPEYTEELSKLQSSLKPLPISVMKKVISDDLGHPADEVFSHFKPEPVGVASIGQVYACTMIDGPEVVVKVQNAYFGTSGGISNQNLERSTTIRSRGNCPGNSRYHSDRNGLCSGRS